MSWQTVLKHPPLSPFGTGWLPAGDSEVEEDDTSMSVVEVSSAPACEEDYNTCTEEEMTLLCEDGN